MVGEPRFGEVGCDHQSYGVGVDQSDVKEERDQVVVQNVRLQSEVGDDEEPRAGEGKEAKECLSRSLTTLSAGFHDVAGAVESSMVMSSSKDILAYLSTTLPIKMIPPCHI